VRELLPSLSQAQANVLGLISYGIVMLDGCGLTRLSNGLGKIEEVPSSRQRQRLREFYYEAGAKRGKKRREVDVQDCFGDLLRGLLHHWQGKKELALALDASTLGERFTSLNVSVMYRGCGIPVAWIIIPAHQKGKWRPYWERMLQVVGAVVPKDWKVIVLADRGLYAAWLFEAIVQQGWHPFMRVNATMGFRAEGQPDFRAIGSLLKRKGRSWSGQGTCSEEGERLQASLLIRWEKGYEEAVAVVTDLPEEEAEVGWYFVRFWIESEYKDHKSGGFGWQQTKMTDAKRAERLWLAMAVAMQVAVLVGGLEEAKEQEVRERGRRQVKTCRRPGRPAKALWKPRGREQSVLMRGLQSIKAAVIRAAPLPLGYVVHEPWPSQTYRLSKPTKGWRKYRKKKEATQQQKQRRRQRDGAQQATADQLSQREQAKRQRQASRAKAANRAAERQQAQEAQRKQAQQEQAARRMQQQERQQQRQQEVVLKRQERIRARQEREHIREQRRLWHEEIQREREARQLRRAQQVAQSSSLAVRVSLASSKILPLSHAISGPLEPP
jgi:hypothetical protein